MSPATSTSPPRRPTSVNVEGPGPIITGNNGSVNGIDVTKGGVRVLPHLDDLKGARPIVDIFSPIRTIVRDGESLAKQADTYLEFRRPDLALQEYIKATVLVTEIIPRHKDYPSLQAERGEVHRAYTSLIKRIQAQNAKVDAIVEVIREDNTRSGVQPTQRAQLDTDLPKERVTGHVRAQSVQAPATNGASKHALGAYRSSEHSSTASVSSVLAAASENAPPVRMKPPIQRKPDALHGKPLQAGRANIPHQPPEVDLATRFARLRSTDSMPVQDPRVRTNTILIPESLEASAQAPATIRSSTVRPSGPRPMTSTPRQLRMSIDVPVPAMPRPPDAVYSPERTADSLSTLGLSSSVPYSLSYPGNNSRTSAPPIPGAGPSSYLLDSGTDYFSSNEEPDTPNSLGTASRFQKAVIPEETTVGVENLVKYIRMGSQALRLLIVDLRSREEFDGGHIMAQSIICVEPITLRDGMSAEQLGESIILSPDNEQNLFEQRHEFDLIVFYDQSSASITTLEIPESKRYLHHFSQAVFDYGYSKRSRRRPVLLLGGLDAWVDLMGPGSLQTSTTGTSASRPLGGTATKPSRPLSRVPMARGPRKFPASTRQPRESRPLSREEENKWAETLREDTQVRAADAENLDSDEFSYVKTTEDFFRKYPELPSIQESMISAKPFPLVNHSHDGLPGAMPRPPTRPAPALPRQRSSGISEKGPIATYAMSAGNGPDSITQHAVSPGLTGLDTTGVTCYVNAVLQCLSATKGFRDFLINFDYPSNPSPPWKPQETSDPPQLLARNLKIVFGFLWCGRYQWITPKTFWGYVNALHAKTMPPMSDRNHAFCGNVRQHDAQEFLTYIFEVIADELNLHRDIIPYAQITRSDAELDSRNKLPDLQATSEQWEQFLATDNSIVSTVFGGLELVSNTCEGCGYISKRWNPFPALLMNFPQSHNGAGAPSTIGLDQLFKTTYGTTELVTDVQCQGCKIRGNCHRRQRLSSLPDYLVVYLVRFDAGGVNKVRTKVIFQEGDIDITRFWLDGMGSKKKAAPQLKPPFKYDCYAAVAHRGASIRYGHYLAYAKSNSNGTGHWNCFNDKNVTKVNWSTVQQEELAILFLKRKGV